MSSSRTHTVMLAGSLLWQPNTLSASSCAQPGYVFVSEDARLEAIKPGRRSG